MKLTCPRRYLPYDFLAFFLEGPYLFFLDVFHFILSPYIHLQCHLTIFSTNSTRQLGFPEKQYPRSRREYLPV